MNYSSADPACVSRRQIGIIDERERRQMANYWIIRTAARGCTYRL